MAAVLFATMAILRLLPLLCLVVATARALERADVAPPYTVLTDKDIKEENTHGLPYAPGKSAVDCAEQCAKRADCVAISWNAPASPIHDGNCNFKCRVGLIAHDPGEQAVIVKKGLNLCNQPAPAPAPVVACVSPRSTRHTAP